MDLVSPSQPILSLQPPLTHVLSATALLPPYLPTVACRCHLPSTLTIPSPPINRYVAHPLPGYLFWSDLMSCREHIYVTVSSRIQRRHQYGHPMAIFWSHGLHTIRFIPRAIRDIDLALLGQFSVPRVSSR